jgi:uncharacterized membrane protein
MAKKILYIMGCAVALLMMLGLLINYLLPLFGVSKPLTTIPIITSVLVCLIITGLIYFRKHKITIHKPHIPIPVLLLVLIPILVIGGTELVNYTGNNILLMIMIPLIVVVPIICLFTKVIPENYWSFAIWMMALAVVLHRSLVSPYLIGTDSVIEFRCFRDTIDRGIWVSSNYASAPQAISMFLNYNTTLSVTILPTMISKLFFIDGLWVFKVVFPVLLSTVPVAVYELVKSQFNSKIALLSAFGLMSIFSYFTILLMTQKQLVSFFFMSIFFVLYFDKSIKIKLPLLFVLGCGVIFSHYGTAIIFIGLVLLVSVVSKKIPYIIMGLILGGIAFMWYKFSGNGITASGISYYSESIISTEKVTGDTPTGIIPRLINQGVTYLPNPLLILYVISQIMVVAGFVIVCYRWIFKHIRNIRLEYLVMSLAFLVVLALEIFPKFSNLIGLDRVYIYCMMVLFPFVFVTIDRFKYWAIIGLVLVSALFLWNVGYINEIEGHPLTNSIALDTNKSDDAIYTQGEMQGAMWVLYNTDGNGICSDNYGQYIFYSLDVPSKDLQRVLDSILFYTIIDGQTVVKNNIKSGTYIYLRRYNIQNEQLTMHYFDYRYEYTVGFKIKDLVGFSEIIDSSKLVYQSKDCKVIQTTKDYEGY